MENLFTNHTETTMTQVLMIARYGMKCAKAVIGKKDRYGGAMYWLTRKGLDWLGEKLGVKIYDEDD